MSRGVATAAASAGLALLALLLWAPLNHDVAGILHVARRMFGGECLYADVADPARGMPRRLGQGRIARTA